MSLQDLGEIGGILATVITVLGLLVRYVFIPLKKFTKKLQTNSREILDSLPVLFALAHHWPLQPEVGSLTNCINQINTRLSKMEAAGKSFLRDCPYGVFRCDLEGKNLEVNRTYARWLEVGEEELLGHKWRSFIKTSTRDAYDEEWESAFEEGREVEFEIEMRTSKFENKHFNVRAYPILNSHGVVEEYFGILVERA